MLVIISDLHLGDGTTAELIPASAFYLFAKRLRQDAHFASLRNGKYRPIEELDVILMGDILDPLHSTKWLFPTPKDAPLSPAQGGSLRPDHGTRRKGLHPSLERSARPQVRGQTVGSDALHPRL